MNLGPNNIASEEWAEREKRFDEVWETYNLSRAEVDRSIVWELIVKEIQEAIARERLRIIEVIRGLKLTGQFESEWINKLAKKVNYEEYAEINNEIIDEILTLLDTSTNL